MSNVILFLRDHCCSFSILVFTAFALQVQAQFDEFTLPEAALANVEATTEELFGESRYAELLNQVDSFDLLNMGLGPDTIRQLLFYRRQNGPFLSPYELQQLTYWDAALITDCLHNLENWSAKGKSRSEIRQNKQPFCKYLSQGKRYIRLSVNTPLSTPLKSIAHKTRLRLYSQYRQQLRWGIALEKDRGEPWRYPQSPPLPDYASLHLLWRPANTNSPLKSIALGDYELRLGQGLLIYQGYGLFKGGTIESLPASGPRLRAHTGMDEVHFLRGIASEWKARRSPFGALFFLSQKKVDARIDSLSQTVYSLPQTGYHPLKDTSSRKKLQENLFGSSLQWASEQGNTIALNLLHLSYEKPVQLTDDAPYKRYRFKGQQSLRLSIDHRFHLRQALFFGEWALAEKQYPSILQGLLLPLGQQLDIGLLYRYYHPAYTTFYAAPFSEASTPNNEHGFYTSIRYKPSQQWQIDAYCDIWRKPWLSFHYNSPRRGYDGQVRLLWERRKHGRAYLQMRFKNKEQFQPNESNLHYERLFSWRFHFLYKLSANLEWRMRLERKFWSAPSGSARGLLFYQELVFAKLGFPLRWNFRWTHYRSDSYDTRIYAYERGLLDQHSISVFSGAGQRLKLNVRCKMAKNWSAELSFRWDLPSQKILTDRMEISAQIIGNW